MPKALCCPAESAGPIVDDNSRDLNSAFSFPDLEEYLHSHLVTSSNSRLPLHIYDQIAEVFNLMRCVEPLLCIRWPSFSLLKKNGIFIQLYIDGFQSTLPFIHHNVQSFDVSLAVDIWGLLLLEVIVLT